MNKITQSVLDSFLDVQQIQRPIISSPQTKKQKQIKSQPFHLDVNTLMMLPASVYWMNTDRIYLDCNDISAWAVNVPEPKDFTDRVIDNFDSIPHITREIYSSHDKQVLENQTPLHVKETIRGNICLSHKIPLFNKENKLAGALGISFIAKNKQEALTDKLLAAITAEKLTQSNLNQNHNSSKHNNLISKRERDCILQLMLGRTAKEIARALCISPRTVEYYLNNAKNKLGCFTRSELIEKALKLGVV